MSDFKSQQEIWKYLVDGGSVKHGSSIYKFKNGSIVYCDNINESVDFTPYTLYSKHIEPVYEYRWVIWDLINEHFELSHYFYANESEVSLKDRSFTLIQRIDASKRERKE